MPPEILVVLCLTHFRGENQLLVTVGYIRYNEEREKSMKNELAGDLTLAEGKNLPEILLWRKEKVSTIHIVNGFWQTR